LLLFFFSFLSSSFFLLPFFSFLSSSFYLLPFFFLALEGCAKALEG
jgi:hypothetical protein